MQYIAGQPLMSIHVCLRSRLKISVDFNLIYNIHKQYFVQSSIRLSGSYSMCSCCIKASYRPPCQWPNYRYSQMFSQISFNFYTSPSLQYVCSNVCNFAHQFIYALFSLTALLESISLVDIYQHKWMHVPRILVSYFPHFQTLRLSTQNNAQESLSL